MTFAESVKKNISSYVDFKGTASRSEFWWFVLLIALLGLVAGVLDVQLGGNTRQKPLFQFILGALSFLPLAGLSWRRIADAGLPGWLSLLPTITAAIYYLILLGQLLDPSSSMTEDEENGLVLIQALIVLPYLVIWCLPSKVADKS